MSRGSLNFLKNQHDMANGVIGKEGEGEGGGGNPMTHRMSFLTKAGPRHYPV